MTGATLVMVAKYPEPSKCKTRLAAGIGPEAAAAFALAALCDLLERFAEEQALARRVLLFAPVDRREVGQADAPTMPASSKARMVSARLYGRPEHCISGRCFLTKTKRTGFCQNTSGCWRGGPLVIAGCHLSMSVHKSSSSPLSSSSWSSSSSSSCSSCLTLPP
jgi:hypothetical protein